MADTKLTPSALAEELGIDPKRLRGYLRKEFPRQPEARNSAWDVSEEAAAAARERFAPKEEA